MGCSRLGSGSRQFWAQAEMPSFSMGSFTFSRWGLDSPRGPREGNQEFPRKFPGNFPGILTNPEGSWGPGHHWACKNIDLPLVEWNLLNRKHCQTLSDVHRFDIIGQSPTMIQQFPTAHGTWFFQSPMSLRASSSVLGLHFLGFQIQIQTVSKFKHVRCNPDVAPRLTSGGYEDKVDVITPIKIYIVHRRWGIWIPDEDFVDVITPINMLFRGGGEFWSLMKIKLMFLPNQYIVYRGWRILTPHEDKVDAIIPINILFRGAGEFWPLVKMKWMLLPQSTYCSEGVANFNVMMVMMWWYYPNQHIVHRWWWRILIPYEHKVGAVTPINILFIGGGEF